MSITRDIIHDYLLRHCSITENVAMGSVRPVLTPDELNKFSSEIAQLLSKPKATQPRGNHGQFVKKEEPNDATRN